jgi:hypothetical protein
MPSVLITQLINRPETPRPGRGGAPAFRALIGATRAWWVLSSWGFSDVRVLDGGLDSWVLAGGVLESGPLVAGAEEEFDASTLVDRAGGVLATQADVLAAIHDADADTSQQPLPPQPPPPPPPQRQPCGAPAADSVTPPPATPQASGPGPGQLMSAAGGDGRRAQIVDTLPFSWPNTAARYGAQYGPARQGHIKHALSAPCAALVADDHGRFVSERQMRGGSTAVVVEAFLLPAHTQVLPTCVCRS